MEGRYEGGGHLYSRGVYKKFGGLGQGRAFLTGSIIKSEPSAGTSWREGPKPPGGDQMQGQHGQEGTRKLSFALELQEL
jgi:hypothetical protein